MRFKAIAGSTGTILYPYTALDETNGPFGLANRPWAGWFQDSAGYIYIKLNDGRVWVPSRKTTSYRRLRLIAAGLYLMDVAYWKLEGIIFEDFGTQNNAHVLQPYRGLDIRGARNIVIDNCTFRDCPAWCSFHQQSGPFCRF